MTRTRLAGHNFLSSLILSATAMTAGFVAAPFLVRWLGEEQFGAYRTTLDWLGYLAIPHFGLQGALFPLFARALEGPDTNELRRVLAAAMRAYGRVALWMIVAGLGLAAVIPLLASASGRLTTDLRLGCIVGLFSLLLWPLQPFQALTEANQRRYVLNGLLIVQSLLTTALALLFAWRGWGVTGQMLAVVVGGTPSYFVLTWLGIRRFPGLWQALRSERHISTGQKIRRLNTRAISIHVCGRLSLLTDNIVIAFFLGPAAVTPFFLTQRLLLMVQTQLQGIGNASWAGLAQLHHQNRGETFRQRVVDLTRLNAVLGVAILIPMSFYNRSFVQLWVGSEHFAGETLTYIASLNAFLLGFSSLWGWCFQATGRLQPVAWLLGVSTAVNVLFSFMCTRLLGLSGPLLGTLLALATVNLVGFLYLLWQAFGISPRQLMWAILVPVACGMPYGILVFWTSNRFEPSGWAQLTTAILAFVTLYAAVWWRIGCSRVERQIYRRRIIAVCGLQH